MSKLFHRKKELSGNPSLGLNFLMNIVLTMSTIIFPLITFPYISRILLVEGVGKVQTAVSFVAYFTFISQLGIPTYGIKVCAAVRDDRRELSRTVQELMIIQSVTTVISYAAFFVLLQAVPKLQAEKPLYLITGLSVFLGMIGMEWLFKSVERYTYITVRSVLFKVVALVAMFLWVNSPQDYVLYGAISVLASSGSNLMNLTQFHKYVDLKPTGGYNIKRHIKPVLILFAYTCATTVYTNLDTVMLGFMTGDADVGYYSTAVKIKIVLVSIVTSLATVLLPRVSYYYEHGMLDDFWSMIRKSIRFIILLATPLTVYFILFAKQGILLLSGAEFEASVIPMIVIMPTVLFIGLTSVTGAQILIPSGREKSMLFASVAGAVVDFVLNMVLIYSLRATGAAIGTLIAEIIVFLWHAAVLKKELAPIWRSVRYGSVLLATVFGIVASFWVRWLPIGTFFVLALSAMLFFGVYLLALHVAKEPMLMELEEKAFSFLRKKNS